MLKKTGKKNSRGMRPSEPNVSLRLKVLTAAWIFGFLVVVGKLVHIQVVDHGKYNEVAEGHLEQRREVPAQRGAIKDRNGHHLAVDLIHYSLAVRPSVLENPERAAEKIGKIINLSAGKIIQKMNANKSFVYLAHRLNHDASERLKSLYLKGLILEKKFSRYYPYDGQAAQVVGYCDFENNPRAGLELKFNEFLEGKSGWTAYLRDAFGNQVPYYDFPTSEPANGFDVETTLDMTYQSVLEEELSEVVLLRKANHGSAVLMDPQTGEVLAMATYPGYNPNKYNRYPVVSYKNRAISDQYEPGSTFKMVALAMCLEQLNLNMEREIVFCENGTYRVHLKDVKDHKNFGWLTARQAFEQSSNIGVMKL